MPLPGRMAGSSYVVTGGVNLADGSAGPQRPPDGSEFKPPRQGVWNVFGLTAMAEPGTRAQFVPAPTVPYQPNIALSRPSLQTDHIRGTFASFDNHGLNRPAWAWHPAPPPAQVAPRITGPGQGNSSRQNPQRVFPGRATNWPRVVPSYGTFGSGA